MKNIFLKYRISFFLCGIFPVFAQAAIYHSVDAQGNAYFSDTPTSETSVFALKPINTYTPFSLSKKQPHVEAKKQNAQEKNRYQTFVLKQPNDQADFQNTQEVLAILEVEPSLQAGDSIQWWLDGKVQQKNKQTEWMLPSPDRGEHTLQAILLDAKNHILMETEKVTFYVHLPTS